MKDKLTKWLIVTEKPSVANDIAKALGSFEKKGDYYESENYYMTWAVGHLLELLEPEELDPKYKRWLLQDLPILPEKFSYKPKKGQTERLGHIRSLAKKDSVIGFVNACDAGREGELIFREIYDYCAQKKPFQRLWLQSMTTGAIREGFNQLKPGTDYDPLADAASCRSQSDWLIGMNCTRALTKRLKARNTKGVWSIGRVQTPTLALLVKRELEYLQHRPEPYFTLEGRFSTPNHAYSGFWFDPKFKEMESLPEQKDDRIFSKEKLDLILKNIETNQKKATAWETRKESKEIAPQLFDLTLLQREANRKFSMTAVRTLQAAQRLYEKHKLLTYPRTDSRYLPEDYLENVNHVLKEFAANLPNYKTVCKQILKNGLLNQERVFNNKFVSDHFAIIPTGLPPAEKLDGDDARIFDLVLKRFLAAFMPHALWAKVERTSAIGEQYFRTRVQDLSVPGWREVYGLDAEEESSLPPLNPEQPEAKTTVSLLEAVPTNQATKPPPRLTEAKLLSLMEHCGRSVSDEEIAAVLRNKGIGTPATRADIIENLISKEYVMRVQRSLKATSKGIRLMDVLARIPIEELTKVELTGEIEFDLRQMEKNLERKSKFMERMYAFTTKMVEAAKSFNYAEIYKNSDPLGLCPVCQKGRIYESFWGYRCEHSAHQEEDCRFIIWKEKNLRYIDRSLVAEILEKKIAGPFEFLNQGGNVAYEEYLAIAPAKGLVFCDAVGAFKESATPGSDVIVLQEEFLNETYLGLPGHIKVTETAFMCEFGVKPPTEIAPSPEEAPPKKRGRKKTANPEEGSTPSPSKKKPVKVKKLSSRMPRILCTRHMSLDDYRHFIQSGSTPPFTDFKSKKGRPFGASLHLKNNGNFEFKFVSRKALMGDGEKVEKKEAAPKKNRRKANVVKV